MMSSPFLEVQEITKVFSARNASAVKALDHVSFCVEYGESVGLIGASGSGKSTVAKAICRFIDVTAGNIFLQGRNITHAKGKEALSIYKDMQMIFQSPHTSFDPHLTLGESIGECFRVQGIPKAERQKKVQLVLEICGLPSSIACMYPREASGGQCQRAAIARALAVHPKLLICDEATSALDVVTQQHIIELLMQLKKEQHLQYVCITHNLALAQQFCDRLIVMNEGRVVEEGTTQDVICHPHHSYTKHLIDSVLL